MKSRDINENLVVILVIILVFGYSLFGTFVFDDSEALLKNPDLNINNDFFPKIFLHDFWGNNVTDKSSHKSYRPLTILFFRIIRQYSFWFSHSSELNAFYFHFVNLIFYIVLCIILKPTLNIFLHSPLNKLSNIESKEISFLTTLIFAVHPLHCEVVCSCVGLADILMGLLCIVAFNLYMRNVQFISQKEYLHSHVNLSFGLTLFRWQILITILVLLSMFCKETGITFLGIFAVFDIILFLQYRKNKNKVISQIFIVSAALYIVSSILSLYIRLWIINFSSPNFSKMDNPSSHVDNFSFRWINFSYIYFLNVFILVCPIWLCFDWSMGCIDLIVSFLDFRVIWIVIFWLSFLVFIWKAILNKQWQFIIFSLFSIITFLPSSNLFFQVGFVIAERNLFLPILGFLLIFTFSFCKISKYSSFKKFTASTGIYFVILIYSICAFNRTLYWNNELDLFEKDAYVCPKNAKIFYNIAKISADMGDSTKAIFNYRKALKLYANYTNALNNLANILKEHQQISEAKSLLEKAVSLDSNFATGWMNLAIIEMNLKNYKQAESFLLKSIQLRPNHANAYFNLGNLYLSEKRYSDAENMYLKSIQLDSKLVQAWNNLILLKQNSKQSKLASKLANEAIKLNPREDSLHFLLANLFGESGDFKKAEFHFNAAIKLNPNKAVYYNNLAVLYHRMKIYDLAIKYYEKTLQLNPGHQKALKNLKLIKSI